MSTINTQTTTFNPALKTLDFSAWTNPAFDIKRIVAVYNKTQNVFIYAVGSASTGYTSFSSNVMTLAFDTTAQNAGDTLSIFFSENVLPISATTLPLPTGAATSALQTTGNSSLSSIDAKTPALGQGFAATSVPVVLTAAQITSLIPPTSVTANIGTTGGLALDSTVAKDSSLGTINASVNTLLKPASTLAAVTTLGSITNAVVIKADTAINQTNSLKVDGSATTQPISGSVGINAGSNIIGRVGIDQTTNGTTNRVNIGTDGTVAINASLPTGANTIGQVTANAGTNLNTSALNLEATQSAMSAKLPAVLGARTIAQSMGVNIASDQVVPISATSLPLPTDASSSTLQIAGNSSLSNIDNNLGTQSDSAATTDTGTFSIISFIKRGLQNWTTLLARIPILGQAATNASIPVALANENIQDLFIIGQGSQSAAVNNILPTVAGLNATDLTGYRSAMVQVVSGGTAGTFIFEGSNHNVSSSFQTIPVCSQSNLTGAVLTSAITATISTIGYVFPVNFRYIRLRIITPITGGVATIQAFSKFMQTPYASIIRTVSQPTAANLSTTATIASGTVTTVSTVTTLANGQTAHSAASTGSPVRVGGRVNTNLDTSLLQGDASDLFISSAGQAIQKPFGTAENDWQFASAAGGILNTTIAVTIKAAGAASIRNYITGITIMAQALGAATELVIRDGAAGGVVWRTAIPTTGLPTTNINFPTPLKGSAATLLEVATTTATVTGAVYFNAQGYQSF